MPTVYIETTIPSFYFETRSDPTIVAWREATRRWWDHSRRRFDLVTSRFVLVELAATPGPKGALAAGLLGGVRVLAEPPALPEVIEYYVEHKLMPRASLADAAHLAMASLHSVDFLLTWNCRHLANASKARHVAVLNGRLGLPTPVVTTPEMLIPETDS